MSSIIRFLMALTLLTSCEKEEKPQELIRPVITETVRERSEFIERVFPGQSKAEVDIKVSFRVSGQVEALPVLVGDRLEEGALIARLDNKDLQLELERAQAALDSAQADYRNASASYKRIKSLYESESASRNELDEARAAFESSEAAVDEASKGVELAKQRLSYAQISAPQGGCSVSEVLTEVNENISAGEPIATLICGSSLKVEIGVPEQFIVSFQKDMGVLVTFDAIKGEIFRAVVREVGVSASGGTTFPVTLSLIDEHPGMRSGMAVKVRASVKAEGRSASILVPFVAVGEDRSGNFVYVFKEKEAPYGVAEKRQVEVGDLHPEGLEVRSGLEAGEMIITAGVRYLRDGKRVRLQKNTSRSE